VKRLHFSKEMLFVLATDFKEAGYEILKHIKEVVLLKNCSIEIDMMKHLIENKLMGLTTLDVSSPIAFSVLKHIGSTITTLTTLAIVLDTDQSADIKLSGMKYPSELKNLIIEFFGNSIDQYDLQKLLSDLPNTMDYLKLYGKESEADPEWVYEARLVLPLSLKKLDISYLNNFKFDNIVIYDILRNKSALIALHLNHQKRISGRQFHLSACLKILDLSGCYGMEDDGLFDILVNDLSNLEELNLSYIPMDSIIEVIKLPSLPQSLTKLNLSCCELKDDVLVVLLSYDLSNLKHLDLSNNKDITFRDSTQLLPSRLEYLEDLAYFHCRVNENITFKEFTQLLPSSLEYLNISRCDSINIYGLCSILSNNLSKLEELYMDGLHLSQMIFEGNLNVPSLPQSLFEIHFNYSDLVESAVKTFLSSELVNLKLLDLSYNKNIVGFQLDSGFLPSSLEYLDLSNSSITDDGLSSIFENQLCNLKHLDLSSSSITDDGLSSIFKNQLRNLKHLDLSRCFNTDTGLNSTISKYPLLSKHLTPKNLTHLDLSYNENINGKGWSKWLPSSLNCLYLTGCTSITFDNLKSILSNNLSNLKKLYIGKLNKLITKTEISTLVLPPSLSYVNLVGVCLDNNCISQLIKTNQSSNYLTKLEISKNPNINVSDFEDEKSSSSSDYNSNSDNDNNSDDEDSEYE
jgi:hypothetical protein